MTPSDWYPEGQMPAREASERFIGTILAIAWVVLVISGFMALEWMNK